MISKTTHLDGHSPREVRPNIRCGTTGQQPEKYSHCYIFLASQPTLNFRTGCSRAFRIRRTTATILAVGPSMAVLCHGHADAARSRSSAWRNRSSRISYNFHTNCNFFTGWQDRPSVNQPQCMRLINGGRPTRMLLLTWPFGLFQFCS